MTTLHLDFESRSTLTDLKRAGVYNYATHPTTDILCACYAIDNAPVQEWLPGMGTAAHPSLWEALADPSVTVAGHNVAFEWHIIEYIAGPFYGWPRVTPERLDDTAARAAVQSLPRDLAGAANACGLPVEKDAEGRRLMLQMCKPRSGPDPDCPECEGHGRRIDRDPWGETCPVCVTWWEDDERLERLIAYCRRDVEVERALDAELRPLSKRERRLWLLDFRANHRGVRVDMPLVGTADRVVRRALDTYGQHMSEATDGAVTAVSQTGRLAQWLGVPSVAADRIDELLASVDLSPAARQALLIRKDAGKSSTAKLEAFRLRVSDDGRMRGNLLYHGAGTGRWSGMGVQLQNLPRPELGQGDVELAIAILMRREWTDGEKIDALEFLFGSVPVVVASLLRSCLISDPGYVLDVADYSNIEGRKCAWVAGEEWKLAAFRDFDAGRGPDVYKVAAGGIFGIDPAEIGKGDLRQIGKVSELSLQYQGGVGAFVNMGANYGLDMDPHFEVVVGNADPFNVERAEAAFADRGKQYPGLSRRAWIASEVVKLGWRAKHPRTVALWYGLESAALAAFNAPGAQTEYAGIRFQRNSRDLGAGAFLICKLPSGRCMYYPDPRLRTKKTPWGEERLLLTAMRQDSQSRKWVRASLYGGEWTNNVVQGLARDILAAALLRLEDAGYPRLMLTVHDEIIGERPERSSWNHAEFERLMAELPQWAAGLPVAVSGYEATRYRKD